jgi:hypothetical protein
MWYVCVSLVLGTLKRLIPRETIRSSVYFLHDEKRYIRLPVLRGEYFQDRPRGKHLVTVTLQLVL